MCGPKGYHGFSVILAINRVLILAILVTNRVWFLHCGLELGVFLEEATFFIIINKTTDPHKSPSKVIFRATVPAATVVNTCRVH